jgi:Spy/CpxP family protein refolding chaperone
MTMRATSVMRGVGFAVALAALVTPGAPAPAAAASGPAVHGRLAWLQQAVGLTEQQVEAIRTASGPLRDQMWEVRLALGQARGELRAAMAQDPLNAAAIQAPKDKMKALLAQRVDLAVDMRLAVRQQLTPEQRETLARLFAERRARWFRQQP